MSKNYSINVRFVVVVVVSAVRGRRVVIAGVDIVRNVVADGGRLVALRRVDRLLARGIGRAVA